MHRQEISIVEFADTTIPPAAASYRTEDAYPLKILFQHNRFVIEVMTVSAALQICFFLCTKKHPAGHIHLITLFDNFPRINKMKIPPEDPIRYCKVAWCPFKK
jgi:hypothetical protein